MITLLVGLAITLAVVIIYAVYLTFILLRQHDRIYTPAGLCRECCVDPYNEYGSFTSQHHPSCPVGKLGL